MNQQIKVSTKYDCTATKTVGRYRAAGLPTVDATGAEIVDLETWEQSRNKQRNYETLLQVISLRSQPLDLSSTTFNVENNCWEFTYSVEFENIYKKGADEVGLLKDDMHQIPMIVGLGEVEKLSGLLEVSGDQTSIWFELI